MASSHKDIDRSKTYFVINIREAQGLRAADNGKHSNPFCVVKIGGHKAYTTQTIHKTIDPKWFEKLYVGSHRKHHCTPITKDFLKDIDIHFFIWDSDFKDELLGIAALKGSDVIAGFDDWIELKEHLGPEKGEKVSGRINIRAKYVEK